MESEPRGPMTRDEVKMELCLHLAKELVRQSTTAGENLPKAIIAICTFSLTSYLTMLNVFSARLAPISSLIKFMPLFIWIVALIGTTLLSLPKITLVDFKNPEAIIDQHSRNLKRAEKLSLCLFYLTVFGLVWMSFVIF